MIYMNVLIKNEKALKMPLPLNRTLITLGCDPLFSEQITYAWCPLSLKDIKKLSILVHAAPGRGHGNPIINNTLMLKPDAIGVF
jgi:hypothetical protein